MKNLTLILIILLSPFFLFAQETTKDKRLKLMVNNGISVTGYFDKEFLEGELCGFHGSCYSRKFLKNKPSYFFDVNLTYSIGKRQHLGIGTSTYQMAYLMEFDYRDSGFRETGIVQEEISHKFNSYYLTHLWTIKQKETTTLSWNNSLGIDYQDSIINFKNKNPFYRTGIVLEQRVWRKLIFTFQPFVQTAFNSYTNKRFDSRNQLVPITFGGSIGLKLHLMEFY